MSCEQLALFSVERPSRLRIVPLCLAWASPLALLVLLAGCAPFLMASTRQFQKAVVISVDKSQPTLPYRRRLADSPPPPTEFDFEVTLRVNCRAYVALYQTAIDYLPSAIAPDQSVEVSVEKHVIRVKVSGGREITLENTRHYNVSPASCSSNH